MSLTNPNKPITKQDLADFYGEILPYLGGMPSALANKFSRGDLFSTDEKMIGCWIDGRPLYQKTVSTGGSVPSGATLIERIVQTGYDTIRYTKSSDSANSFNIGSDTDYSTEEKIVGTWIDGSYIYQKTINFGSLPNKTLKSVAHNISNLGEVIGIKCVCYNGIYYMPMPLVNDDSAARQSSVYVSATNIEIENRNINYSSLTCYITLQYTKSST